ncbi:RAMP superfamily CRISPR-associated protein [Desulforamulus putei]|uniref:CRISPR/Cas system CSM-associated protein Csm3, group 7 of RAMP superfamily n=1 Tax=Desulforamulus putei DSM 12395 TaxID=1121429 RepID=A0A1M4SH14_9FIRM|nr:RAMP superfamily CRISPR-associated protein [Desulforamulus putei]SHE31544.1 CRISPR/Cas system CSM-associated protein Csm3, group 7 of RAMP superfamily [Desulforamulus putei DSM 12395]
MEAYKVITAELVISCALHLGSGEAGEVADALLIRDERGAVYLPGTALAGALREKMTRLAPGLGWEACRTLAGGRGICGCPVCRLMGEINSAEEEEAGSPMDRAGGRGPSASRLYVYNAFLKEESLPAAIRDGVGIDRVTGTAARAARAKFNLEVLPPGAVFSLRLELRGVDEAGELLLAAALAEWQEGRGRLGGRVTSGLGVFRLRSLEMRELDLGRVEDVRKYLASDRPWEVAGVRKGWLDVSLESARRKVSSAGGAGRDGGLRLWCSFAGRLQFTEGMVVSDPQAVLYGFDHVPLTIAWDQWDLPVLPGSALKGVIRVRAEKILRTIWSIKAQQKNPGNRQKQAEYFKAFCPACDPLQRLPEKPLAACDALLTEAGFSGLDIAEEEDLCLACRLFGSTRRGGRLFVSDALFSQTDSRPEAVLKLFDFLAVDRFTGGGAGKLKYDAVVLCRPQFELHLYIENPRPWELGLLALVLRDFACESVRVGYGGGKGFGLARLTGGELTVGYLQEKDLGTINLSSAQQPTARKTCRGIFNCFTLHVPESLPLFLPAVNGWIEDLYRQEVSRQDREEKRLPPLLKDYYFDREELWKLYPLEVQL